MKFKVFPKIVFIFFFVPRMDQAFIIDENKIKEPTLYFWSLVIVKIFNYIIILPSSDSSCTEEY